MGCLGGGQLGRMLALAGYPLGLEFVFLEPKPRSSAGQVGRQLLGEYEDRERLEELGESSDLVTFEFESVPDWAASELARRGPVFPSPRALAVAQDRLLEKRLFGRLGIPFAAHAEVAGPADLGPALALVGTPSRLKSRRLGYDGHGQAPVRSAPDLEPAFVALGRVPCILEREVPFERELSVLGVRSGSGETAFYPLAENRHLDSILRVSIAPAPRLSPPLQGEAEGIAAAIMRELDYVGVLAVELFQVGGHLLANEIAPRVHNSGHWTIDGAPTSQFENHLRAGLGWPLGPTSAGSASVMVNILGELPAAAEVLAVPGARLHLYGKEPRPGRKLGHLTLCGLEGGELEAALGRLARLPGITVPPA